MSTLGSLNFIRMAGPQIPAKAVQMRIIDRAGVDGVAFREDANKVPEINLRTTESVVSQSVANASSAVYQSYIGTLVTIIDDHALISNNVMVLGVLVTGVRQVVNSTDGNPYLVYAAWIVKPTA